jgi:hypothetical protein
VAASLLRLLELAQWDCWRDSHPGLLQVVVAVPVVVSVTVAVAVTVSMCVCMSVLVSVLCHCAFTVTMRCNVGTRSEMPDTHKWGPRSVREPDWLSVT